METGLVMETGQVSEEHVGHSSKATVLVVDDNEQVRVLFRRLLSAAGFTVELAPDGPSALTAVAVHQPDVILLDCDLPEIDGFEVCRRLKAHADTRLVPIVFVTGLDARADRVRGLAAGGDEFLTKPVDPQELLTRVRSSARLKQFTDDLDSGAAILMTLAKIIEARDSYGEGHCSRLAHYATRLGRTMGLDSTNLQTLYRAGFLHDVGMLVIPEHVQVRSGPLDPEEYELVKCHTLIGERLCGGLHSMRSVCPIIRSHHERLDGSGYPDGLSGDRIALPAQIIGLVETFEALTVSRPHRQAIPAREALDMLEAQVTRGWRRPDLVESFVALVADGQLGAYP